jgi:hypothetical protein
MTDYSIKRFNPYTREEIILALKEYAKLKKTQYVVSRDFCSWFGISEATIERHFGKWSILCGEAGLNSRYTRTDDKHILLENLGMVWEKLGRQPRAKEMKQPLSPISCSLYSKVFKKNWYQICLEFLSWKSGMTAEAIEKETRGATVTNSEKRKTNRGISLSLRYEVLKRDGFKCINCGNSPAMTPDVVLHVDHIQPWAKGGETVLENLQTLCSKCNLGKSDKQ